MPAPPPSPSMRALRRRLYECAADSAAQIGLEVSSMKLIQYGFNATFKVIDTQGQVYALKLVIDSPRSYEYLCAELRWCDAMTRAGLSVSKPQSLEPIPIPLTSPYGQPHAIAYHWIFGRKISERPSANRMAQVCGLARSIFSNPLPKACKLPEHRNVLGVGPNILPEGVLTEVVDECQEALDQLWRSQDPLPLHFDLHNENVLSGHNGLVAFDFEYAHIAPPLLEAAILHFFYSTPNPRCDIASEIKTHFQSEFNESGLTDRQFHSLTVAHRILFTNDVLLASNPDLIAIQDRYLKRTIDIATDFLSKGRYEVG